jgi:hypothetical protein
MVTVKLTIIFTTSIFIFIQYSIFIFNIHIQYSYSIFIAITQLTASGYRGPLLPHHMHSIVGGGRGGGGAFSAALKICFT